MILRIRLPKKDNDKPPTIVIKTIEIIISIPAGNRSLLRKIIHEFDNYPVKLVKLPDITELTEGKISIEDLKKIDIEDLLGRDAVAPDAYLLKSCIENKTVMITGCGGSIGSELARQIIKLNPKKLIMIDKKCVLILR